MRCPASVFGPLPDLPTIHPAERLHELELAALTIDVLPAEAERLAEPACGPP
jgi:hypothetical protein